MLSVDGLDVHASLETPISCVVSTEGWPATGPAPQDAGWGNRRIPGSSGMSIRVVYVMNVGVSAEGVRTTHWELRCGLCKLLVLIYSDKDFWRDLRSDQADITQLGKGFSSGPPRTSVTEMYQVIQPHTRTRHDTHRGTHMLPKPSGLMRSSLPALSSCSSPVSRQSPTPSFMASICSPVLSSWFIAQIGRTVTSSLTISGPLCTCLHPVY